MKVVNVRKGCSLNEGEPPWEVEYFDHPGKSSDLDLCFVDENERELVA